MKAVTKSADISSPEISTEYEFELKRLLFLAPAITEALALDTDGVVQAQASRFRAVAPLLKKDLSQTAAFQRSKQGQTYFGAVYFRDSDPYVTVAVPIERLRAKSRVSFKRKQASAIFWTLLQALDLAGRGLQIRHYPLGRSHCPFEFPFCLAATQSRPRRSSESSLPSSPDAPRSQAIVAFNVEGQKVFSSYALIPNLDWAVFIERPTNEAYAPIYASLLRTSILLLIGLGVLCGEFLCGTTRSTTAQTLRQGVERIREGDLSARLDVKTGDEIEILADEFNDMAAHLREAYAGLSARWLSAHRR